MNNSPCLRISIPAHVLWRELDGESVLLDLDRGYYFSLDKVGTRVWSLLAEHRWVEPACHALLGEFEVGEEQLRADVMELIKRLAERQLLVIEEA